MRHLTWTTVLGLLLAGTMTVFAQNPAAKKKGGGPGMTLTSTAFPDGGTIPIKYSQAAPGAAPGEGTSPALSWSNVPAGTQSFVLHMHDLEVARNRTTEDQVHWLVWNIPGETRSLPEGLPRGDRLPDGSYQTSATGPVYRGPGAGAAGPPHHYTFELYALDTKIDIPPGGDPFEKRKQVMEAIQGHILAKAVYMGLFKRPQ